MEVGKLKTNSTPIFYFILDASNPDRPDSSAVSNYFVTTEVDSYVEAYYFLCRSLCTPVVEKTIKKWFNLYVKVFGTTSLDNFTKNLQTLPTQHFQLDTSEGAARSRLADHKTGDTFHGSTIAASSTMMQRSRMSSSQHHKESNLLVYPQKYSGGGEAEMELHRIKAELTEVNGQLRTEKSKAQVDALSEAERSALLYKLEQSKKDAESERLNATQCSEKLHTVTRDFEERLNRLLEQHEFEMRERQTTETNTIVHIEETFLQREKDMRDEFEGAVKERDRKLNKAVSKYRTLETQFQEAASQIDQLRKESDRLHSQLATANDERDTHEETVKRQKLTIHSLEQQLHDANKHAVDMEQKNAVKDKELGRLRAECDRFRRESERFAMFTSTLHGELREIDTNTTSANDLLKRKILRHPTGFNPHTAQPMYGSSGNLSRTNSGNFY